MSKNNLCRSICLPLTKQALYYAQRGILYRRPVQWKSAPLLETSGLFYRSMRRVCSNSIHKLEREAIQLSLTRAPLIRLAAPSHWRALSIECSSEPVDDLSSIRFVASILVERIAIALNPQQKAVLNQICLSWRDSNVFAP
jgi:hypothetical protein